MTTITPELLAEIRTVSENAAARNRMAAFWPTYSPQTMLALVAALEDAQRERGALHAENEKLRSALDRVVHDIDDLIGNSNGVCGLHLNGDAAPWASLTDGGQFEAWLSLDHARAALKETTHAD